MTLAERVERIEAASAIRALVTDYFDLCDRLDETTSLDVLGELFTVDAEWAGTGARYATALGAHAGRAEIVAMLDSYRGPPAHFTLNAHFLTNERIVVDGDRARGKWLMLQTSSYAAGGADLRAARLQLDFACLPAGWRIRRFQTEQLFGRDVERWNDQTPLRIPNT